MMDALFGWLNPGNWVAWVQDHPWLALGIGLPLGALVAWRLIKGGLGIRRAVVNVAGVGLVIWGSLWFADWVRPSLTSDDLFTLPVVGPQAVKVALATEKALEKTATYTGSVHPYERIIVRARTDGFVERIAVYPGDRVQTGQVVVRQETSELEPRLAHVSAELRYLRAELKRDEELFNQGAISASVLDLSHQKEQVAAARVKMLSTEIEYAMVRAPSDGWVSDRMVDPGQFVQRGQPLIAYDRLAEVRIRFDVAVRDLVFIDTGTEVILEFPEIPENRLSGSPWADQLVEGHSGFAVRAAVTAVFPRGDERTRLGVAEVMLANPGFLLKSNTYVIGHFVVERVENAWVVPTRALTPTREGKTVIFVAPAFADQGEVEMREVKLGIRNGDEAQILEGLDEPSYVVIAGNRGLTDGETVTVVEREGWF